ncbi:Cof-type HAD-IIB family hydrolase [Thermodesulfobacteriota bacterium]
MVVSDIDGTLITREGIVTETTIKTIEKLKERGILFATISARSKKNSEIIFNNYSSLCDSQGYVNGGYVIADNETIMDERIDNEIVSEIYYMLNDLGVSFCYVSVNEAFALVKNEAFSRIFHLYHQGYGDLKKEFPVNIPIYLIAIYGEHGKVSLLGDYIESNAGLITSSPIIFSPKTQNDFQLIQPATADKGKALTRISEYYSIPLKNIMVFGDGIWNDLPMMKLAGKAVAMKNARGNLKDHTHDVTMYNNNEDGVARYLFPFI